MKEMDATRTAQKRFNLHKIGPQHCVAFCLVAHGRSAEHLDAPLYILNFDPKFVSCPAMGMEFPETA